MANKGASRTRIVPGLGIDELSAAFEDCKVFSKLDMNNGYHQLRVDEDSAVRRRAGAGVLTYSAGACSPPAKLRQGLFVLQTSIIDQRKNLLHRRKSKYSLWLATNIQIMIIAFCVIFV